MKSTVMNGTRRQEWREMNGQGGIPVCDMLDSLWPFLEIHTVESLEELEFSFLGKAPREGVVPNNKPPLFNVLGRA